MRALFRRLQRSRSFYQDVVGLQVIYEDESSAVFDFDNTIINWEIAQEPSSADGA